MNAPTRRPDGTMLKGFSANPGGRPRSTIEQVREALLPDLPLFLERLAELTQSNNETIRLQARGKSSTGSSGVVQYLWTRRTLGSMSGRCIWPR
jgi:hypothetical protein